MAQKVRVQYFDDIDGQPIMDGLAQSFRITVDDDEYEIDLRPANADKFLAVLRPWLHEKAPAKPASTTRTITPKTTAARARTRTAGTHKAIPPTRSPEQLAAIRHWARNKGYDVSSRGRIPRHILERFEAAHS
ncbi:lysyl tRNA synthetase-like protein [Rhodococcus gordoniae]|uniref:Lysyl tRNA synthetase-like protein n=1 Tax=Rhodococcus gordoniae TaxID=223392 RepID=A0A379M0N4_9NOCA|nr:MULTISPECIES: Lsr2 family protein [Rhodococcus]UTT48447.1 Lsr2 family protein [Rhodococcus gordoniae]SUE15847.1 lysyl tRNA synthetase-like protein [Rhodococcus gordoniae]